MSAEYRVVYQREGHRRKAKRYATLRGAERLLAILTSDEPWRAWDPNAGPDDLVCCRGHMCGCGGETQRERSDRERATIPALEFVRIESRSVGEWAPVPQEKP